MKQILLSLMVLAASSANNQCPAYIGKGPETIPAIILDVEQVLGTKLQTYKIADSVEFVYKNEKRTITLQISRHTQMKWVGDDRKQVADSIEDVTITFPDNRTEVWEWLKKETAPCKPEVGEAYILYNHLLISMKNSAGFTTIFIKKDSWGR